MAYFRCGGGSSSDVPTYTVAQAPYTANKKCTVIAYACNNGDRTAITMSTTGTVLASYDCLALSGVSDLNKALVSGTTGTSHSYMAFVSLEAGQTISFSGGSYVKGGVLIP